MHAVYTLYCFVFIVSFSGANYSEIYNISEFGTYQFVIVNILATFWIYFYFFQEVMKSTRLQLEQELGMNEISTILDMPAFKMLK